MVLLKARLVILGKADAASFRNVDRRVKDLVPAAEEEPGLERYLDEWRALVQRGAAVAIAEKGDEFAVSVWF